MSTTNVEIPDSRMQRIEPIASEQQVTVEQFIAAAVAEKAVASDQSGFITARARRADEVKFADAISHIPDTEPEAHGRL